MKSKSISSVSILTLGCSKNAVDSETILTDLKASGVRYTDNIEESDALIINTCGFIKPAKEESINVILEAAELKKQGKLKKLIVSGCLSQRYKDELKEQIGGVDHFFGINAYKEISEALTGSYQKGLLGENRLLTPSHFAYMKISDGCDHPCSFCAIPLIRGKHVSRPMEEILFETENLVKSGTKEIVLIAQDTTDYGKDLYGKRNITELMDKLSDINGLEWLRLMYTYPTRFPEELPELIASKDNICNYIDIPLQHISDSVLKSMRRGITGKRIRSLIDMIRDKAPGIAIRSTFITGYPNESDKDFEELLSFIKEYELDRVGVFTYSSEEDTTAFDLGDPIPEDLKLERSQRLMEAQMNISRRRNEASVGNITKVVIDSRSESSYLGRTEFDAPEVDNGVIIESSSDLHAGDFIQVEITGADDYDIYAKAIE